MTPQINFELSPAEADFYACLFWKSKSRFDDFVAHGRGLSLNFTSVLQLILVLRQALCHPTLVMMAGKAGGTEGKGEKGADAIDALYMKFMNKQGKGLDSL